MKTKGKVVAIPVVAALASVALLMGAPAVSAAPANRVDIAGPDECYLGDRYCGGSAWVPLTKKTVNRLRGDADWFWWGTLRNAKGKKIKLQYFSAQRDYPDNHRSDFDEFYATKTQEGPLWWFPTNLPKGRYTFTWRVKQNGIWDCSLQYYEVCKWKKGFDISGKKMFKYKPGKPEWLTP